jgi:hypothetical protein
MARTATRGEAYLIMLRIRANQATEEEIDALNAYLAETLMKSMSPAKTENHRDAK